MVGLSGVVVPSALLTSQKVEPAGLLHQVRVGVGA
jgi:hypothetical protein